MTAAGMPTLWRRALITITAAGALVASFIFLTDLALQTGWPAPAAPLLPLCIDALAAMALTQYRAGGNRTAAAVAVGAIAVSALGNAASHWFASGLLEPGWLAVTLVGVVPAVSLGLCVHLTVPRKGAAGWDSPQSEPRDVEVPVPVGAGSPTVSRSATPARGSGTARGVSATGTARRRSPSRTHQEWVELIESNGLVGMSADRIIDRHGGSKPVVLKALRQVRDGQPSATVAAGNGHG